MKRIVLVFVRLPEPGRVKTRLARSLGNVEACRIYRVLAERTFDALQHLSPVATLGVCFTPSDSLIPLQAWLTDQTGRDAHWLPQVEGNLGDRQAAALAWAFANGYDQAALIGTDCPSLTQQHLAAAWEALDCVDWVFGPAADGGYYLAATKRSSTAADLFKRPIRWSSEKTLSDCEDHLRAIGQSHYKLEILEDIDKHEHWQNFKDLLPKGHDF